MSTYKRVSGDYTIQTLGANTITFAGNVANAVTVVVDGNFSVTGNATLQGNISGDKLFNGSTSIEIQNAGGNANITVGGVSNVAVFTPSGINITGNSNISGNAVIGNLTVTGVVAANVTFGNINTTGNITILRDASLGQPTMRFQDTDQTGVVGQILGALEWFTSDITAPGVSASIRATLVDTGGNSNVQIFTGTPGSQVARLTVLHTGNVGIANTAPNTTLGVTGTAYISGNTTVLANIAGGNINTAGRLTVTGNIGGGNINTGGLITATGNITGGNITTAGRISAGAAGITATGNVRGGNLISDAAITATGSIASGANISSQGQISSQGNVIANNISAGNIVSTGILNATSNVSAVGNVTGSNLVTGGSVTAVGAVTGGSITTGGLITAAGNITTGAFFVGDGGFLSNVTAISNVTTSQITNGTTIMAVAGPNGNIFATINAVGNILVLSPTGAQVIGVLSATGNVTGGNITTGGVITATGNLDSGNVNAGIGNFVTVLGAANASNLTTGTVSSDRLSGSYVINVTGNVSGTAATVTNAAQANITSVGNLSGLTVTGNLLISGAITDSAQLDIQTSAANANIVLTPNGTGNVNIARMSASGNIRAGVFHGNGAGLGSVNAATIAVASSTADTTFSVGLVAQSGSPTAVSRSTSFTYNPGTNELRAGGVSGVFSPYLTNVRATTAATSTSTGALRVQGGAGIAGNVYAAAFFGAATGLTSIPGGNVTGAVSSATSATSATTAGTVTTAAQGNITSVGTLTALAVTGNVTAGNLITTGTTGSLSVNNITHTGTNAVGNIGSASSYFNQVFATATTALYADLAEKYTADAHYKPGTVLSFGGSDEVTVSTVLNDRRIAGVVSANPSYLMNAGLEATHTAVVALQGRVFCMVQGPVVKGDMMVSAGNGRAQSCDNPLTGAVIGKALENFDSDQGMIEVVVGRI